MVFMATALICLVLIIIAVFGIRSYRKRLTSGCCSPSDETAVKKVKVKDKDISHYPYHKILKVDGMTLEMYSPVLTFRMREQMSI